MRNKAISSMLKKGTIEEIVEPKEKKKTIALVRKLASPNSDAMIVYHYYLGEAFTTWRGRVFIAKNERKLIRFLNKLD